MTDFAALITQLRVLAYLTRTEAQVARLRVAQATGDDVREELRRNAADADARAARVAGVLRDLGALPDPVAPALGRVAALVRGTLEQTQPLDEALLGDLALEHQLRDRARYVATLADAVDLPNVRALADDLVAAHTETVDWLRGVLDDVAAGRRAALNASPLQRVAAQVTRAANAPARPALDQVGAAVTDTVGRTVHGVVGTVAQAGGEVRAGVAQAADSAVTTGHDVLRAGRDTATQAAGAVVSAGRAVSGSLARRGTDDTPDLPDGADRSEDATSAEGEGAAPADATEDAVSEDAAPEDASDDAAPAEGEDDGSGATLAEEDTPPAALAEDDDPSAAPADADRADPLPGFGDLSARAAIAALRTLDDPADVAAVLAFERAHGNRPGVVAAAQARAGAVR
jgi:bacterioferritin (cytochrome b1)